MKMFKKILNRLKPKYKRCSDIRYLKYLYAVNAFCGFFPFYNFDNCTLNENFYPSKIHPMLTIILRMLSSMLLVYEFRTMFYNDFNFIPQTLYIIQSIIVVLINVIPTIQLAYFNRRSVTSFIENFRKIDEMMINLNVTLTNLKYFDTFLVEILVFQVTFTLIISADYWFQSDDIYGGHGFKIVGALAFIGIQLFLYLICNFALALRARFRSLNDMIVNLRDDNRLMTAKSVQIHEFYEILIELTYTYNELFGWSILLYIAALFVSFLQCFTDLLSASQFTDYTLENLTAVLILLITGVILIVCGDLTNSEIKRTKHNSLKIISHLPNKSIAAKYITYIAFEISLEQPELTAADLFPLTLSTLLALIGSLASYVIIILQFYK